MAYHGQVLLHPPEPNERMVASASMGLVGVKEEGDGCEGWRFIEMTSEVDLNFAATICRQMGFTHVTNILNRREAENLYSSQFSRWFEWL